MLNKNVEGSTNRRQSWQGQIHGWARMRLGTEWQSWSRACKSESQSNRFSSSGRNGPSWLCIDLQGEQWNRRRINGAIPRGSSHHRCSGPNEMRGRMRTEHSDGKISKRRNKGTKRGRDRVWLNSWGDKCKPAERFKKKMRKKRESEWERERGGETSQWKIEI